MMWKKILKILLLIIDKKIGFMGNTLRQIEIFGDANIEIKFTN